MTKQQVKQIITSSEVSRPKPKVRSVSSKPWYRSQPQMTRVFRYTTTTAWILPFSRYLDDILYDLNQTQGQSWEKIRVHSVTITGPASQTAQGSNSSGEQITSRANFAVTFYSVHDRFSGSTLDRKSIATATCDPEMGKLGQVKYTWPPRDQACIVEHVGDTRPPENKRVSLLTIQNHNYSSPQSLADTTFDFRVTVWGRTSIELDTGCTKIPSGNGASPPKDLYGVDLPDPKEV